jgi:hypothetical protein
VEEAENADVEDDFRYFLCMEEEVALAIDKFHCFNVSILADIDGEPVRLRDDIGLQALGKMLLR